MSWYTDPELFIYCWGCGYALRIVRICKKYNVPVFSEDFKALEKLDFSEHLSLGNNKESDYDALKSILAENSYEVNAEKVLYVNCQGLVVYRNYSTDKCAWSRVELYDSIFYSLPGIKYPFDTVLADKQAVEEKFSLLENKLNNEVTNLQGQLDKEKNDRQALEKQVLDLTAKLQESRAAGSGFADGEPWMSGCKVPSYWVPFEELDVQNIPKDTPLTITEAPGAPKFGKDTTTNVQADCFSRGIFPIVVVSVADLIPNNGKARFDPDIWCSLNSAGNSYAARKQSESEMSFESRLGC